ncbi:hypothetical protein D3C87_1449750 [compost metagenome]
MPTSSVLTTALVARSMSEAVPAPPLPTTRMRLSPKVPTAIAPGLVPTSTEVTASVAPSINATAFSSESGAMAMSCRTTSERCSPALPTAMDLVEMGSAVRSTLTTDLFSLPQVT